MNLKFGHEIREDWDDDDDLYSHRNLEPGDNIFDDEEFDDEDDDLYDDEDDEFDDDEDDAFFPDEDDDDLLDDEVRGMLELA
jgi:hypothetical protein